MELKDYIKQVVNNIAGAVDELNTDFNDSGNGTSVCPAGIIRYHESNGMGNNAGYQNPCVTTIKFKIIVGNESSNDKSGGVKLGIKLFDIGGSIETKSQVNEENTIEFSIPIQFKK